MAPPIRNCPFCGSGAAGPAHPFESGFAGERFRYWRCAACGLVYIDPVPSAALFERMYESGDYHESFYGGEGQGDYDTTARRLAKHLPAGARVLDFGCGSGHLLAALKRHGLEPAGVEFSPGAANRAAARAGAEVFAIGDPGWRSAGPWDCIHFGDVIEHLPEPRETLASCLPLIRDGGLLSAEGPLEDNRSLVHWAARLFAGIKRRRDPSAVPQFPPYHLLFASARSQRAFFAGLGPLEEELWRVAESGWPYLGNGAARDLIARAAIAIARAPLVGGGFGNRFVALYRVRSRGERA